MSDNQFHSFPFHTFLKENKLGTGGMNQRFISTPTLSLVLGTHGNGWEPVGTGELLGRNESSFHIILSPEKVRTKNHWIAPNASPLPIFHKRNFKQRVVP